jgi:hypothetical protein
VAGAVAPDSVRVAAPEPEAVALPLVLPLSAPEPLVLPLAPPLSVPDPLVLPPREVAPEVVPEPVAAPEPVAVALPLPLSVPEALVLPLSEVAPEVAPEPWMVVVTPWAITLPANRPASSTERSLLM